MRWDGDIEHGDKCEQCGAPAVLFICPRCGEDEWVFPCDCIREGAAKTTVKERGLREALAAYAHASWSWWMRYMLGKIADEHAQPQAIVYDQETRVAMQGASFWGDEAQKHVDRWRHQMDTPYNQLPEEEKESDRAEADKILTLIHSSLHTPRRDED